MNKQTVLRLDHRPGNPRNSEGSFLALADGRILFVYSRYSGGGWGDNEPSDLGIRRSGDGGRTWSAEDEIFRHHGDALNLMSVSLLRLKSGRILLAYLEKSALSDAIECRPKVICSDDEAATWSEPVDVTGRIGLFVLNNDRVIELGNGRLILPTAVHRFSCRERFDQRGFVVFHLSDDGGCSWREAPGWLLPDQYQKRGLQEPGVTELPDGRLLCFCRTAEGSQYLAWSEDGGENWTRPVPSEFKSPVSPMSIKRDPYGHGFLAVWNDVSGRWPTPPDPEDRLWGRNPLALALSRDGANWSEPLLLEDEPDRGYCYAGIHFTGDEEQSVLLSYCCGRGASGILRDTRLVRLTALPW